MSMDKSAVFHISMLDEGRRALFNPLLPWVFATDEMGVIQFATEYGACMAQREYRAAHGFDRETGEQISPTSA